VTGETACVRDANAAEDQGARLVERMDVDALPDPDHDCPHFA
jgi:hypothetical protein